MVETHRLTKYVVFILGNCTAGYMIVGKTCRECPVGTYQDKRWQTECIPCGNQMVTERKGATSSEECTCECRVALLHYDVNLRFYVSVTSGHTDVFSTDPIPISRSVNSHVRS